MSDANTLRLPHPLDVALHYIARSHYPKKWYHSTHGLPVAVMYKQGGFYYLSPCDDWIPASDCFGSLEVTYGEIDRRNGDTEFTDYWRAKKAEKEAGSEND